MARNWYAYLKWPSAPYLAEIESAHGEDLPIPELLPSIDCDAQGECGAVTGKERILDKDKIIMGKELQ